MFGRGSRCTFVDPETDISMKLCEAILVSQSIRPVFFDALKRDTQALESTSKINRKSYKEDFIFLNLIFTSFFFL